MHELRLLLFSEADDAEVSPKVDLFDCLVGGGAWRWSWNCAAAENRPEQRLDFDEDRRVEVVVFRTACSLMIDTELRLERMENSPESPPAEDEPLAVRWREPRRDAEGMRGMINASTTSSMDPLLLCVAAAWREYRRQQTSCPTSSFAESCTNSQVQLTFSQETKIPAPRRHGAIARQY